MHAGLVHDLGRVAVSATIWQRPGPLSDDDWEKVRLHPYHTERFLARAEHLARLGSVASLHHKRLDGRGYHRGASAGHLAFAARLLAAADLYQAMIEPRPHRPALPAEAAADQLAAEARRGRLDPQSVTAVCGAAGHRINARRRDWPADLTDREVEVLRLLATGLTNPEMAGLLHLSPKTVGHHVEHLYDKIGVSSRPAAALFAMEHDLLRD
jgi:DNA-binding CsgD family transcriptional regulator